MDNGYGQESTAWIPSVGGDVAHPQVIVGSFELVGTDEDLLRPLTEIST
jgi:hypothetical protein